MAGEFWDRYWGCCMLIVNTVGVGAGPGAEIWM